MADYSLRLKELYKQTGRTEKYEKELWLLMLQYRAGDVAVYKELKNETVVCGMAAYTSDRKHYHELVAILKRMQKYPGGQKRVNEIAGSWRQMYRNRPAMMDELSK